jgi:hypothetical protein
VVVTSLAVAGFLIIRYSLIIELPAEVPVAGPGLGHGIEGTLALPPRVCAGSGIATLPLCGRLGAGPPGAAQGD